MDRGTRGLSPRVHHVVEEAALAVLVHQGLKSTSVLAKACMALSPRTARELERAYAEWREQETRAALSLDVAQACEEAPDTPQGRLEVEYQLLRERFSPAYFSGSRSYRGSRLLSSRVFQREQSQALRQDIGRGIALQLARSVYSRPASPTSPTSPSFSSESA